MLGAVTSPMSWISISSSTPAARSASRSGYARANAFALAVPMCRMPSDSRSRASPLPFASSALAQMDAAVFSPILRTTDLPAFPADSEVSSATRAGSSRNTSAKPFTMPESISWSTIRSPRPSMSIWLRPTNHLRRSRNCSGHAAFVQKSLGPSFVTGSPQLGHAAGGSTGCAPRGRFARSTSTTCGMISPAFSTITVSPIRMSLRWISSMLWSVACWTLVPAITTGSMVARGVSVPPFPTCHAICRRTVGFFSAGYLNATAQRGAFAVTPSSRWSANESTFTTMPSTAYGSSARAAPKRSMAATHSSAEAQRTSVPETGTPSARRACRNSW